MTKITATITIEIETPENIAVMTPVIRAEFTTAIGAAYRSFEAPVMFNRANGARKIGKTVIDANITK